MDNLKGVQWKVDNVMDIMQFLGNCSPAGQDKKCKIDVKTNNLFLILDGWEVETKPGEWIIAFNNDKDVERIKTRGTMHTMLMGKDKAGIKKGLIVGTLNI